MNRKIIIIQCKDCPFVDTAWGLALELVKDWPDTQLFCNHEMNGNAPEEIKTETIPEWCPLEEDKNEKI